MREKEEKESSVGWAPYRFTVRGLGSISDTTLHIEEREEQLLSTELGASEGPRCDQKKWKQNKTSW